MSGTTKQQVRWIVDMAMGAVFLVTVVTGLFNWTLLMRTAGLTDVVLPLALMSEIHSWAGPVLAMLVFVHLFINRAWILATTRKILFGMSEKS
ncbi:MAG: hypothetical protein CVV32_07025 [Methanomicrobiales archaeon HGW-Methanomicrobiales-3]|nr:MAG: hypothetical protein CVV32_07025 [Methanomicrobiales archaeon HGW-Methanomicrobiales-3]